MCLRFFDSQKKMNEKSPLVINTRPCDVVINVEGNKAPQVTSFNSTLLLPEIWKLIINESQSNEDKFLWRATCRWMYHNVELSETEKDSIEDGYQEEYKKEKYEKEKELARNKLSDLQLWADKTYHSRLHSLRYLDLTAAVLVIAGPAGAVVGGFMSGMAYGVSGEKLDHSASIIFPSIAGLLGVMAGPGLGVLSTTCCFEYIQNSLRPCCLNILMGSIICAAESVGTTYLISTAYSPEASKLNTGMMAFGATTLMSIASGITSFCLFGASRFAENRTRQTRSEVLGEIQEIKRQFGI